MHKKVIPAIHYYSVHLPFLSLVFFKSHICSRKMSGLRKEVSSDFHFLQSPIFVLKIKLSTTTSSILALFVCTVFKLLSRASICSNTHLKSFNAEVLPEKVNQCIHLFLVSKYTEQSPKGVVYNFSIKMCTVGQGFQFYYLHINIIMHSHT